MRYEIGKPLSIDETRQLELKAVASKNPVRTIADHSDKYAVAFLNSIGGTILWGVRDADRVVEGVALNNGQRDELRRVVTDKLNNIEPKIDPTRFKFDIKAICGDLCVVSLTVPKASGGPFYASGSYAYVRLDGANKLLSGPQLTAWITERAPKGKAKASARERVSMEVYHHGDKLPLEHEVVWDFRYSSSDRASMPFDFHLPANAPARRKEKFGIVTSSFFTRMADWWSGNHGPILLPDGRHFFSNDKMVLNLFPGDWHKYSLTGVFREHVVDRREEMAFRFFTDSGPLDVPFAVRMLGLDYKKILGEERESLNSADYL